MATERVGMVFLVWGFWQGSAVVLGDMGIFGVFSGVKMGCKCGEIGVKVQNIKS